MTSRFYLILLIPAILFSCAEDNDPELEKKKFTSVFDNNDYSAAFYPIDLRQTKDDGYLILAERRLTGSNFRGTYLIKADASGNFVRELQLDQQANPVGDLMHIQNSYYFVALDPMSLQGQLVKVDEELQAADVTPVPGVTYPSAARTDDDGFLLLSYNHVDKTSVLSRHSAAGDIVKGPVAFAIGAGDEVEEPIMGHLLRTGKRFPFSVGKVNNSLYYFNGFQNYTFSLVFSDLQHDSPSGVVQGQQDDGGISDVVPLDNGKFAAARFEFGRNYFLPGVTLSTNGPTIGAYLGGFELPELVPDAAVRILRTTIGTRSIIIYASDTRSKQIGLFLYDEQDGSFINSRYLGFSNPFEVSSIVRTSDDGLAVCGTTWLAGRFPRVCLFKISAEELEDLAK